MVCFRSLPGDCNDALLSVRVARSELCTCGVGPPGHMHRGARRAPAGFEGVTVPLSPHPTRPDPLTLQRNTLVAPRLERASAWACPHLCEHTPNLLNSFSCLLDRASGLLGQVSALREK